jgi:hypothetical protein
MRAMLIAALAFAAICRPIAAASPFGENDLKALWNGTSGVVVQPPTCTQFVMVDTGVTFQVRLATPFPPSPPAIVVSQGGGAILSGPFASNAAAED